MPSLHNIEIAQKNIIMKNLTWIILISFVAISSTTHAGEWKNLFDGKSLKDWDNPYGWGVVKVIDEEIHLTGNKKFFLCLFFGKQDDSNFYYVHLGQKADPHALSTFAVDGEPRVSIAEKWIERLTWGDEWHRARVARNSKSGDIKVYFDDYENPIMEANDKRFTGGGYWCRFF